MYETRIKSELKGQTFVWYITKDFKIKTWKTIQVEGKGKGMWRVKQTATINMERTSKG